MNTTDIKNNLVDRLMQRDAQAYDALYRQYSAPLYGVIQPIVKDASIAGELLHHTILKICNSIEHYQHSNSTFLTWVLQHARAISFEHLSQTKPTVQLKPVGSIELVLIPQTIQPDDCEIFRMILQGYKVNQIAEELNLPAESIKLSIRKAMKLKTNRV